MKKHAQVQIGEMVMILAVVFIMGMIGLVWYLNSAQSETTRVIDEDVRIELAQTARTLVDLPELRYSLAGREDSTIIDWYRARVFSEVANYEARELYAEQFSGYRAELRCVTPCEARFGTLELFDYTRGTARQSLPFVIPVLLYDPVTRASSFGTLTLTKVLQ